MYKTISDLPFVCQLNLPEPALQVYRDAFNEAWMAAADEDTRFATAQNEAWRVVREQFQRDPRTGRWVAMHAPAVVKRAPLASSFPRMEEHAAL